MTDMEKKIAFLLSTSQYLVPAWECTYDEAAKDLVANGVTVQKWIPVTERLPDMYEDVLGWTSLEEMGLVYHEGKRFLWSDGDDYAHATHWMPLPQPPKEGERKERRFHRLKILPQYFKAVLERKKTFEVRRNDRSFQVGDILILQEFREGEYTGASLTREVCYIVDDPEYCKEGFVVLGIQ